MRDKDNALLVPRYSILQDPQGGFYVYVVRGSALKRQTVVPGISDDFNMEITEGLGEKDVIVKTPDTLLSEGMAVTVREMP